MLDVLPWESALKTLLFRGVQRDEDLYDYALSQAYRSIAHTLTSSDAAQGVLKVLSLASIKDAESQATCVFLAARLASENGSTHGEGNHIPDVSQCFPVVVTAYAKSLLQASSQCNSARRREQLGFAILFKETIQCVSSSATASVRGGGGGGGGGGWFVVSTLPDLVRVSIDEVCHRLAILAEGMGDPFNAQVNINKAVGTEAAAGGNVHSAPTRLTLACNVAVMSIAALVLRDLCAADASQRSTSEKSSGAPLVVIDAAMEHVAWRAVSMIRSAVRRHEAMLRSSAHRFQTQQMEKDLSPSSSLSERWLLHDLVSIWDDQAITPTRREYESLEVQRHYAEKQFGPSAKDAVILQAGMWTTTIRCALMTSAFCDGLLRSMTETEPLSSASKSSVLQRILRTLGERVALLESNHDESPHKVFVATASLLEAVGELLFTFPMSVQQEQFWSSSTSHNDRKIVEAIHQAILMRPLRYQNLVVHQLGSILSTSILASMSLSCSSGDSVDLHADELLDMLATARRDGATHGAVQLVALAAVARPHSVIPTLFRFLTLATPSKATAVNTTVNKSSADARANALDVLAVLPDSVTSQLKRSDEECKALTRKASTLPSSSPEYRVATKELRRCNDRAHRLREVLRILSQCLLETLGSGDEILEQRMVTASLFSMFQPEDVVPPLVKMILRKDTKGTRRSAATKALLVALQPRLQKRAVTMVETDKEQADDVPLDCMTILLQTLCELVLQKEASGTTNGSREGRTAMEVMKDKPLMPVPQTPADILRISQLYAGDIEGSDLGASTNPSDTGDDVGCSSPASVAELKSKLLTFAGNILSDWVRDFHAVFLMSDASQQKQSASLLIQWFKTLLSFGVATTIDDEERDDAASKTSVHHSTVVEFRQQLAVRCATATTQSIFHKEAGRWSILQLTRMRSEVYSFGLWVLAQEESLSSRSAVLHQQLNSFSWVFALICMRGATPSSAPSTGRHESIDDREVVETVCCGLFTKIFLFDSVQVCPTPIQEANEGAVVAEEALKKLALEVLCGMDPRVALSHALRGAQYFCDAVATTSLPQSQEASARDMRILSDVYRAYLFLFAFHVSSLMFSGAGTSTTNANVDGLLEAYCQHSRRMCRSILSAVHQHVMHPTTSDTTLQVLPQCLRNPKILLSSYDAMALMLLRDLDGHNRDKTETSNGEGVWAEVRSGLTRLVDSFQAAMTNAPENREDILSVEAVSMLDIHKPLSSSASGFSLDMQCSILQASAKIVKQQQLRSKQEYARWTALWGRSALPLLIQLANVSVAFFVRRFLSPQLEEAKKDHNDGGVLLDIVKRCIDVIFTFVVMRGQPSPTVSRASPPSSSGAAGSADNNSVDTLALDAEDRDALLLFSVGCLQFSKIPSIQYEGVKLSAACLATFSNALFQTSEGKNIGQKMLTLLSQVALLHPLPEARRTAQHVMSLLDGAIEDHE